MQIDSNERFHVHNRKRKQIEMKLFYPSNPN